MSTSTCMYSMLPFSGMLDNTVFVVVVVFRKLNVVLFFIKEFLHSSCFCCYFVEVELSSKSLFCFHLLFLYL